MLAACDCCLLQSCTHLEVSVQYLPPMHVAQTQQHLHSPHDQGLVSKTHADAGSKRRRTLLPAQQHGVAASSQQHLYEQLPDPFFRQVPCLLLDVVIQVALDSILHAYVQLSLRKTCRRRGQRRCWWFVRRMTAGAAGAASRFPPCMYLLQEGVVELDDVGRIQGGQHAALLNAVLLLLLRHAAQVDLLERILLAVCFPGHFVHCAKAASSQLALDHKVLQAGARHRLVC